MAETCSGQKSALNKVYIWTVPRTLGTALTKCLSYVDGMQIFYEPCGSAFHFGPDAMDPDPDVRFEENALSSQQVEYENVFDDSKCTYAWVRQQLEADYPGKKILLVKDQAYSLGGRYEIIPPGFRHAFLIRHPYKVFPAWKRALEKIVQKDIDSLKWEELEKTFKQENGYETLFQLLQYVKEKLDPNPVIIDADDLQNNPASILRQFCQAVGITYSDSLLEWPSDRDIINTWKISRVLFQGNQLENEGGFYENALRSTGFLPGGPTPKLGELSEDLQKVAQYSMTFYDQMYQMRLKP